MMKQLIKDKEMLEEISKLRRNRVCTMITSDLQLRQENEKLRSTVKQLSGKIEYLDKLNRKKNLIITG